MKFAKYLLALAFAFCAFTGATKAQTVSFLGGGSSALFNELGSASQAIPGVSCLWSYAKTTSGSPYFAFRDDRTGVNLDENGTIFIAWTGTGGSGCSTVNSSTNIYIYISLDSVLGDRCYFINDGSGSTGCQFIATGLAGVNGTSQVSGTPDNPAASPLPTGIISAIAPTTPLHSFAAGTDIRPEDAKFATLRMFTPCNQLMPRQYFNQDSYYTFGLGYGSGNVGTAVSGDPSFGGGSFNVVNFNITGNDPITGDAVPGYAVNTVGAQPMIVAYAPSTDANVAATNDITGFTFALFYEGVLGRTSDFIGPTAAAEAVTTFVREPLSGTFNTTEFSIPNGTQYHAGQETGNCTSGGVVLSNPMEINNGNGVFGTASQRVRVIGTGNMTKYLGLATSPTLGYFFWSAGNAKAAGSTVKYLKVNGVDPLLNPSANAYNGVLPGTGGTGDPGLGAVTFTNLNAGDYAIWSPLRIVGPSGNAGVAAMITALGTLTQHDFITPNNLTVWKSHFFINNETIPNPANGATVGTNTLCSGGLPESGGDAGGANMLIVNNAHFCSDYGVTNGLLNKTQ
jgi:hypothetical protein